MRGKNYGAPKKTTAREQKSSAREVKSTAREQKKLVREQKSLMHQQKSLVGEGDSGSAARIRSEFQHALAEVDLVRFAGVLAG